MIYYGESKIQLFSYDGAAKPRLDTQKILSSMGFTALPLTTFDYGIDIEKTVDEELSNIIDGDIIIVQYPTYCGKEYEILLNEVVHNKGAKVIAIVHDIDLIRFGVENDLEVIPTYDAISLPSKKIYDFLIKKGVEIKAWERQIIWDYLIEDNNEMFDINANVVYAGSLTQGKTKFLDDINFPLFLYGDNINSRHFNKNVFYYGKVDPNEIQNKIGGNIGLVWDSGNYQEYAKYNLPFKVSMYLASNMPLLVKDDSNIAEFVKTYNLGLTINNLNYDDVLKPVVKMKKEISSYQMSTLSMGQEVREGKNMKNLVNRLLKVIK